MSAALRIAWTGPVGDAGGVPGMGTVLLAGLLDLGHEVELYFSGVESDVPATLRGRAGLAVICHDTGWRWDRWYSRHPPVAFLSASPARMWAHSRLSVKLWREHRRRPYDCIFQLSQPELLLLGWLRSSLPPTVVHPCSHAAGELRWHRRESRYARALEPLWLHALARTFLVIRSTLQRRSFLKPDLVVGPSERFLELVAEDYGLPRHRLRLLRHPVELGAAAPDQPGRSPDRRLELVYVSRISSRKGVELVIGLSHRLSDLAGQVHITIVGGHTQWSDYRGALDGLDDRVATYAGSRPFDEVAALYRGADALLVPSRYEPGSLVVGEALAAGLPVVASDEVGPSEVVSPTCMRTFPSGDLDAFEREVRRLLPELRTQLEGLARCAREEAERCFAPHLIAQQLEAILREAAAARDGASKNGKPPKGQVNTPLSLRRILHQPAWLLEDLAPTSVEIRRPLEYVRSVLLWTRVRQRGYTMLGCRRGRTLYRLARDADRRRVPGALVDCGVWNGGSTALLSAGAPAREAYAFDSFEGLPPADAEVDGEHSAGWGGECLGAEENVRDALAQFGSPERLHIVRGWFEDTFPSAVDAVGPIAVLHADGDWYASVLLTLETFYERISPGGYVVVDDYGVWSGARKAVDEFRATRALAEPLIVVDAAAYWRRDAA